MSVKIKHFSLKLATSLSAMILLSTPVMASAKHRTIHWGRKTRISRRAHVHKWHKRKTHHIKKSHKRIRYSYRHVPRKFFVARNTMIRLINRDRRGNKRRPLKQTKYLNAEAFNDAKRISKHMHHVGSADGQNIALFSEASQIHPFSSKSVVYHINNEMFYGEKYRHSVGGHRKNILTRSFHKIGVGVVERYHTYYIVEDFDR